MSDELLSVKQVILIHYLGNQGLSTCGTRKCLSLMKVGSITSR